MMSRQALAAVAAGLLVAGCGNGRQPAEAATGAVQPTAEQEDARRTADKARANRESDARAAARVAADSARFEQSERESGR